VPQLELPLAFAIAAGVVPVLPPALFTSVEECLLNFATIAAS
jgi:hypothetical protein